MASISEVDEKTGVAIPVPTENLFRRDEAPIVCYWNARCWHS